MNLSTIKSNFVEEVKVFLKEKVKDKEVINFSEHIADGVARYLLCSDGFYIGGAYAEFAGESLDSMFMNKKSKFGVYGDYSFGYHYYEVKYSLDTFFKFLDYSLASKIIGAIK